MRRVCPASERRREADLRIGVVARDLEDLTVLLLGLGVRAGVQEHDAHVEARRRVVRIDLGRLAELGERLGVAAVREIEQPGGSMRHRAVRARVERLLCEERGRLLLTLGQVRERQLGESRGVRGLSHEHFASLGDGLVDLPALAERHDVQRARLDGVRMVADEVFEPLGGLLLLVSPALHVGERHRDVLRVRPEPRR